MDNKKILIGLDNLFFFALNKLSDITSLKFISERSWHMYELWTNIWILNHQFKNSFEMIYYYWDCMHSVWHFFIIIHSILIFIFIFHFLLMNISGNTKTNVLGSIFGLSASYISCMTRFRKQRCIYPGVLCMYTMAIRVVEFSNGGYKIRKIFA